jgi:phosphoribosylglycinamide formyltransferase-1
LKKIAILFSGTGSNLAYILEHLHNKELEVAVALTNRPNAGGIAFAKEHGVSVEIIDSKAFDSREVFDAQIVKTLERYEPQLVVLAGFMRILTTVFTDNIKAIYLHPSLLPRHKGIQAIERSYADEFSVGGVSVHWVTSELDGGEVILQREVSKVGRDFEAYETEIKRVEKLALTEGILKVLS